MWPHCYSVSSVPFWGPLSAIRLTFAHCYPATPLSVLLTETFPVSL